MRILLAVVLAAACGSSKEPAVAPIETAVTAPAETAAASCELGDPSACFHLGELERGANADDRAASAYARACEIGHGRACALAGAMYRIGMGVEAAPEQGQRYFIRGCRLGHDDACELAQGRVPQPRP
ncbi:MAG TPA: hypothetical protein VML75_27525 [Kofleriaceae bacterium]|nr:hypothetical protein [Kofleriaceae bacterium]